MEVIVFGYLLNELIKEATTIKYVREVEYVKAETIEEKIAKYDWDYKTAVAIMKAESGGNPQAINKRDGHNGCSGSFGLFQIACIHDNPEKLLDPDYNIERAYELYQESGWKIWGAYSDKRYLTYKN